MAYIDAMKSNDTVIVWVRNEDGDLRIIKEKAPQYFYIENKTNGKYDGLFGDRLELLEFSSHKELLKKRDAYRNSGYDTYESDIGPTYKVLAKNYHKEEKINGPVNIGLYDIEVDFDLNDGKGYPTPDNPYGEINSISLFDDINKTYYMLMLTDNNIKVDDWKENLVVKNLFFKDESDLLLKFKELIYDIDILCGWNSEKFDDLYVYERVRLCFGSKFAIKFFSRDNISADIKEFKDDFGGDTRAIRPRGRILYDLMNLYKNFTQNEIESYSLNHVSSVELKEEKLEYLGNLGDLYRNDPQKFYDYSFYDTFLLKKLNDKLQHVNLAVGMARNSCVLMQDIFGSVRVVEQAIYKYCHYVREKEIILPDVKESTREKAPGAFVYDTKNGIHTWVMSTDLAALYPSIIRSLNIGLETYILQCKKRKDDFIKIVEKRNDEVCLIDVGKDKDSEIKLPAIEIHDFLRDNGLSISANGSIFTNENRSIMAEVLDRWKEERDYYKKQLKNSETPEEKDRNNNFQMIIKRTMNSLYGICLNEYSRFYRIDIAKSITLTGQIISSFQGRRVDEIIEEMKDDRG